MYNIIEYIQGNGNALNPKHTRILESNIKRNVLTFALENWIVEDHDVFGDAMGLSVGIIIPGAYSILSNPKGFESDFMHYLESTSITSYEYSRYKIYKSIFEYLITEKAIESHINNDEYVTINHPTFEIELKLRQPCANCITNMQEIRDTKNGISYNYAYIDFSGTSRGFDDRGVLIDFILSKSAICKALMLNESSEKIDDILHGFICEYAEYWLQHQSFKRIEKSEDGGANND